MTKKDNTVRKESTPDSSRKYRTASPTPQLPGGLFKKRKIVTNQHAKLDFAVENIFNRLLPLEDAERANILESLLKSFRGKDMYIMHQLMLRAKVAAAITRVQRDEKVEQVAHTTLSKVADRKHMAHNLVVFLKNYKVKIIL